MVRNRNTDDRSASPPVVLAAAAAAAAGETEVMRERAAAADEAMVAAAAAAMSAHLALADAVANEIEAAAWAMHSAAPPDERRTRDVRRAFDLVAGDAAALATSIMRAREQSGATEQ
jgi:hypothetical protein